MAHAKPRLTADEAVERFFGYARERFEETRGGWIQGFRNHMGSSWDKLQSEAFVQDLAELYDAALIMLGLSDLDAVSRTSPQAGASISFLVQRRLAESAVLSAYVQDFMAHGPGTARHGEPVKTYSGASEAWALSIVNRVLRFLDLVHYGSAAHLSNDHALVRELNTRLLGSGMVGYWRFMLHAYDVTASTVRDDTPADGVHATELSAMQIALAGALGFVLAVLIALLL